MSIIMSTIIISNIISKSFNITATSCIHFHINKFVLNYVVDWKHTIPSPNLKYYQH